MSNYLVYLAVRWVLCLVQMASLEACAWAAGWGAWLAVDVLKLRQKVTLANIQAAYPDYTPEQVKNLSRQMWEHLFLLVFELGHLPRKIHESNWRDYIGMDRSNELLEALLSDRPVMLVSAHFGNFELANYVLGMLGTKVHAVARPLDNPYLHDFLNEFRSAYGQSVIPKDGGLEWMGKVLEERGNLGLLADQHAGSRRGCEVEFFGRNCAAHKAIALCAMNYEALVAICYSIRRRGPLQYDCVLQTIADPQAGHAEWGDPLRATQWYTSQLEHFIRRAPEQYWWLHNRWKPLEKSTSRRAAA